MPGEDGESPDIMEKPWVGGGGGRGGDETLGKSVRARGARRVEAFFRVERIADRPNTYRNKSTCGRHDPRVIIGVLDPRNITRRFRGVSVTKRRGKVPHER